MKIQTILNEVASISRFDLYRDLTVQQTSMLARLAANRASPELAQERDPETFESLVDLQLINALGEVTPQGHEVAAMAVKYGPRDARRMGKTMAKIPGPAQGYGSRRSYTGNGDASELLDSPEEDGSLDTDAMRSGRMVG